MLEIGRRAGKFHFCFVGQIVCLDSFDFEFSQRAGALEGTARSIAWQVWIIQQFQAKSGNALKIVGDPEFGGVFGRRVAKSEKRAVRLREVALTAGRDLFHGRF